MDFKDKVIAITGAASGIGREAALAFAKRGARLALADISEDGLLMVRKELEAQGSQVYTQVADVSVAEEVGDFCASVYGEMGRVDVLCNNAGVAVGGSFEDIGLHDWEWITGVNLWGVIHGCHYFYPRMIAQGGGGHIVNVASAAGLFPMPGSIPYSTTKFAVVGFSETLRAEAAMHGIGVTAMCPGFVLSGIYGAARDCTPMKGVTREEAIRDAEERLGKRGRTPDKVAAALVAAVENNTPVARVLSEAYVGDLLHRLSRRVSGYLSIKFYSMGQKGMKKASKGLSGNDPGKMLVRSGGPASASGAVEDPQAARREAVSP